LAARGTVFEHAYTQVPHTSFSVATLLTGKHVYSLSALGLDAAHHETLAQVMRRERYKTACFFPPSAFYIDHDRLQAFERSAYDFEYVKYEYLPAAARTDQIIHYLETEKPAHTFVWAHYLEPHEPYELHPGHTAAHPTLVDRYDGEVHFTDAEIERLLAYLRQHRPNALIVIAADHGEEFGEHGGHYHGTTLYDEQVRVPLVFATLDGAPALPARRVHGPVGLVDVAPTLLGLIGIQPSAKMRGRDLGPWLSASGAPDRALGPTFAEIDRKKMIVEGDDKLICDLEADACQLYDLAKDPREQHNLPDSPRFAPLEAHLQSWMAEESRYERGLVPAPDDAQARRALERGRLGERGAAKDLAAQLGEGDLATRREAARLLASLAPDAQVAPQLAAAAQSSDEELRRWAEIGQARLGDVAARRSLATWLPPVCAATPPAPVLCARGAMALGDAALLGQALEGVHDDQELAVALARALAATHDPRALDPLLLRLGEVRTRLDVTLALGELGAPGALPTLERWVAAEPYIGVRAAMVRVIGSLVQVAKTAPAPKGAPNAAPKAAPKAAIDPQARPDAIAALESLIAVEREPLVMRALVETLAVLGAPGVLDPRGLRVPAAGGELWLVGEGAGTVEITQGGSVVRVPFSGVAMVPVRAGAVSLRVAEGATVRRAFWRRAPVSG
jgi:arylsulfatase A-like enzyme/HEAT repeat protein